MWLSSPLLDGIAAQELKYVPAGGAPPGTHTWLSSSYHFHAGLPLVLTVHVGSHFWSQ
jgi:hypothetical protein